MITSAPTVTYPTAPGVAPGTVLLAGPSGASAYQLAVGQGFAGTEAQWLASLVGAPGPASDPAVLGQSIATALQNSGLMPNTTAALQSLLTALLGSLPTSPAGLAPGALYLDGGIPALAQP